MIGIGLPELIILGAILLVVIGVPVTGAILLFVILRRKTAPAPPT